MWTEFAAGSVFLLLALFPIGYFALTPIRVAPSLRLAIAPLASTFCILVSAVILSCLNIRCSWATVLAIASIPAAVCIILFYIAPKIRAFRKSQQIRTHAINSATRKSEFAKIATLVLYLAIGVIVAGFFFVQNLDGAYSFAQEYDNYSHLNNVRNLYDTQSYFDFERGIYPQAWLTLAALCANFLGGSVTVAINASVFILIAFVLPSGFYSLIRLVFPNNNIAIISGSLVSLAFAAFPLRLISFGPLFPFIAAYSMLPASSALLILVFQNAGIRLRLTRMLYFLGALFALFFLHQSSVFAGIVLMAPFICHEIWTSSTLNRTTGLAGYALKSLAVGAFIAVVCIAWRVAFGLPSLQSTVSFSWGSFQSFSQAAYSILTVTLTKTSAPQMALAFSIMAGVAYCIVAKRNIWLVASYCVAAFLYIVNTATDGYTKHLLTGFWYTDSFRVAAVMSLASMPLATIGLATIYKVAQKIISPMCSNPSALEYGKRSSGVFLAALFMVVNFIPCLSDNDRGATTAFGIEDDLLHACYTLAPDQNTLDSDELSFLDKVASIVPSDAVIINLPYDGSMFSYGAIGLDVRYRSWWFDSPFDINASGDDDSIIRLSLCDIASDERVKRAVHNTGAEYVLLLDQNNEVDRSVYTAPYTKEWWTGISSINDSTPGFEAILAQNDMRLYKISE